MSAPAAQLAWKDFAVIVVENIKNLALLEDFADKELNVLCELLQERSLDAGDILFQEGSVADGLYWLADGKLRLSQTQFGEVGNVAVGDALGVLSLIATGKREATVVADGPCRLYFLDRHGYHRLIEDVPRAVCRLHESFLKDFGQAVRESMTHVANLVDRNSSAD